MLKLSEAHQYLDGQVVQEVLPLCGETGVCTLVTAKGSVNIYANDLFDGFTTENLTYVPPTMTADLRELRKLLKRSKIVTAKDSVMDEGLLDFTLADGTLLTLFATELGFWVGMVYVPCPEPSRLSEIISELHHMLGRPNFVLEGAVSASVVEDTLLVQGDTAQGERHTLEVPLDRLKPADRKVLEHPNGPEFRAQSVDFKAIGLGSAFCRIGGCPQDLIDLYKATLCVSTTIL